LDVISAIAAAVASLAALDASAEAAAAAATGDSPGYDCDVPPGILIGATFAGGVEIILAETEDGIVVVETEGGTLVAETKTLVAGTVGASINPSEVRRNSVLRTYSKISIKIVDPKII
jgi:hypothetical protein